MQRIEEAKNKNGWEMYPHVNSLHIWATAGGVHSTGKITSNCAYILQINNNTYD